MEKIKAKFKKYLQQKGLKLTRQRLDILNAFAESGKHLSVDELYDLIRERGLEAGRATVFRTLKLLDEADIAEKVDFGEKTTRYELKPGGGHHDHLICSECGRYIEVYSDEIEELQKALCRKHSFTSSSHNLDIFGVCSDCLDLKKSKGR